MQRVRLQVVAKRCRHALEAERGTALDTACPPPAPCSSSIWRAAAAVRPGQHRVPRCLCRHGGSSRAHGGRGAPSQRLLRSQLPRLHLAAAGAAEPGGEWLEGLQKP